MFYALVLISFMDIVEEDDMNDKDWTILKTLSEEKNITKAAERLYISQPALTYRLKSIEKEFDTEIVIRTPNGIIFTPQGDYLLAYTEEMMLRLRETKEKIQDMEDNVQGTLRIGASSVFVHYELPQILKGFIEKYPQVDIILKTGLSEQINKMLQKNDISVAISRGDYLWQEEKHLLKEEPICLVSDCEIEFENLINRHQITYKTDSSLQDVLENWCHQTFSHPLRATIEVDSMDACRQMVQHGLGWAILPANGLKDNSNLYTKELFWDNGVPLQRKTWVMCRNSSLNISIVRVFIDYLKNSI